jgi:hypothetical protein
MTPYREVREQIQDGDVLLYRRQKGDTISSIIAGGTEGHYSHAAMAKWSGATLMAVESREFHTPSGSNLSGHVRKYPGRIDVFRPYYSLGIRLKAADIALKQTGPDRGYGYWSVLGASLMRLPILRWLVSWFIKLDPTDTKLSKWNSHKYCSQLVVWCYRIAEHCKDRWLVANKGDRFVTPNDLSNCGMRCLFRGLV